MDEGGLLCWGTLRYTKQGSEMGIYFIRGPTFGDHGWALKWASISLEAPLLGTMDGHFFLGAFFLEEFL